MYIHSVDSQNTSALWRPNIETGIDAVLEKTKIKQIWESLKTVPQNTAEHSTRVAYISYLIGVNLGDSTLDLEELCLAGLLHDTGKADSRIIGLMNKTQMSAIDLNRLKIGHALYGERTLRREGFNNNIALTARQHHMTDIDLPESYPEREPNEAIHPYSAIVRTADIYEAMTSPSRGYQSPLSHEQSVSAMHVMFERGSLNQELLEAFNATLNLLKGLSTIEALEAVNSVLNTNFSLD